MTIYIDLIFAINFIYDFCILLMCDILLKRNSTIKRVIFSSLFGEFSLLFLFINVSKVIGFTIKLFMAIIMVIIAFRYRNIKYTLYNVIYMFLCGIIFDNEIDSINYVNIYDECLDLLSFCNNNNEIGFNFNPVIIVFSIIYIIRKKYKLNNTDTLNLFSVFNIKFCQIKECVKLISNLYFDENDKKSTHIINNKKIIRKSFSQKRIKGKKVEKRFLTPNKYINFNFSKNHYIMSIKIYKNEKNRIKEDKWFFRNSYRKRKITKISIKNSSIIGNNINYSINGNDFLISNQILR